MSEHHAVCPPCTRIVTRDSEDEAADIVETHNDSRHGGDDVARVIGHTAEDLNDLMDDVREEFGTSVRQSLVEEVIDVDPWDVTNA